jgi:hypothetical protein
MNEISADKKAQIISAICEGGVDPVDRPPGRGIGKHRLPPGRPRRPDREHLRGSGVPQPRYSAGRVRRDLGVPHGQGPQRPADWHDNPDYGSIWTWTAIDADTKLMPSWHVGDRGIEDCYRFMSDARDRIKVGNRIHLTTDGLGVYRPVVDALWRNETDYGIVVKEYSNPPADEERHYSPAKCKHPEAPHLRHPTRRW